MIPQGHGLHDIGPCRVSQGLGLHDIGPGRKKCNDKIASKEDFSRAWLARYWAMSEILPMELAAPFLLGTWIIALRPAPLVEEINFTPGGGWLSFWYTGTTPLWWLRQGKPAGVWVTRDGLCSMGLNPRSCWKIPQLPHAACPAESRITAWLHGRSARSSRFRTVRKLRCTATVWAWGTFQ